MSYKGPIFTKKIRDEVSIESWITQWGLASVTEDYELPALKARVSVFICPANFTFSVDILMVLQSIFTHLGLFANNKYLQRPQQRQSRPLAGLIISRLVYILTQIFSKYRIHPTAKSGGLLRRGF